MDFIAGVDGGGTKTKVVCASPEGKVLDTAVFGPFNMNSIGAERFSALLQELCAYLNGLGHCRALCIGSAGISNKEMTRIVETEMTRGGIENWNLVGDQVIALNGALSGEAGIALIAGTGSICFGKNGAGEYARSGGWGHLIDDCGSGYALGRAALALAVQTADGRAAAQTLLQAVYQATGSQDVQGILNYVYYSGQDKSAIAALAKAVLACAQADDEASLAILRQGAAELARIAQALSKRLDMPRPRLALLGGLLTHESLYRVLAFEALLPYAQIVSAQHDALWGAAQLAYEKSRETK